MTVSKDAPARGMDSVAGIQRSPGRQSDKRVPHTWIELSPHVSTISLTAVIHRSTNLIYCFC